MLFCECCGNKESLVFNDRIFDEYNCICRDCLNHAYQCEFSNPIDEINLLLESNGIYDENIYGFTTKDNKIIVSYFEGRKLKDMIVYHGIDRDDAIDVLCELC